MKNKFLLVLMLMLVVLTSATFASQDVIEVKLNDKYIDFTDEQGNRVDPTIINDRTMVPMRKIFEALGADIMWDGATQTVTANQKEKEITLQINNAEAKLKRAETGSVETITLDAAPLILNDRTMVPVRFIAEALNKQVGWDAQNRVVVIIDYDEMMQDLNENCSTFMEMMNEQTVELKTFEEKVALKGTLNYKDTESSKNNEKLALDGTATIKKSENLLQLSLDAKITGKGKLYDSLKKAGYNKITLDAIGDMGNNELYVKSSLSDTKKWTKTQLDFAEKFNANINVTVAEFEELIRVPESSLTKDSYEGLKQCISILKAFFGNDTVKVSGKSSKTYTMKWGLEDVLRQIELSNTEQLDELFDLGKATLELSATYKDGMNTSAKSKVNIDWQMKETKERVTISITLDGKFNSYNKEVKIALPKASEIEEM